MKISNAIKNENLNFKFTWRIQIQKKKIRVSLGKIPKKDIKFTWSYRIRTKDAWKFQLETL